MSSPVRFNEELFTICNSTVNKFINLGTQVGNKGIVHTLFFRRAPIFNSFYVGEKHQLSGYCSYCFLYNNKRVLSGVVFISHATKTVVTDYTVTIGDCLVSESPDKFEPMFTLENCGILMFKAIDGSLLLIPSDIGSDLIVRTE